MKRAFPLTRTPRVRADQGRERAAALCRYIVTPCPLLLASVTGALAGRDFASC